MTSETFWNEIGTCEHLVQIYQHGDRFIETLEQFVASGLKKGEGVIVIAREHHRKRLERRLLSRGVDLSTAYFNDDLIMLDAQQTLSLFISDGWPEDDKFNPLVESLLSRARIEERQVHAFGEMVAVLLDRGYAASALRLERQWDTLCKQHNFSLFSAYPKIGFTDHALKSLEDISSVHSQVIG